MNAISIQAPASPMMRIAERTAVVCGVDLYCMLSSRKAHDVAEARQIAAYVIWRRLGKSMPEIGRFFDRDHTTILHAVHKIELAIEDRPEVAAVVDALMSDSDLADLPSLLARNVERVERIRAIRRLEALADDIRQTLNLLREGFADETP
ncbi:MAG: hypothetical protein TEF_00375 [Rhizobiales bacterium NRL2]|jgi:hypothetical protein|nr:MAG: hypothetical protein TEF_00375 [Rhizobiales bacterium NRL2]